jgi:hypothetical protein
MKYGDPVPLYRIIDIDRDWIRQIGIVRDPHIDDSGLGGKAASKGPKGQPIENQYM